jgi:hypothetical protein
MSLIFRNEQLAETINVIRNSINPTEDLDVAQFSENIRRPTACCITDLVVILLRSSPRTAEEAYWREKDWSSQRIELDAPTDPARAALDPSLIY